MEYRDILPRVRFEEMATKPYSNKLEALSQLAASAVMKELHGHPKAIVMFAPLLETNRLENLTDSARQCYLEATRKETNVKGEEEGAPKVFISDPSCDRIWREVSAWVLSFFYQQHEAVILIHRQRSYGSLQAPATGGRYPCWGCHGIH